MAKTKKYIFTLKNINAETVDRKYDITISSNINTPIEDVQTSNITKLSDLSDNNQHTLSFLDESKRSHKCHISMIDFISQQNINTYTNYCCYWCRHTFDTKPIGCPIRYVSNMAIKNYYSEVSKDVYTIKENIPKYKIIPENDKILLIHNDYYETDGIFCSFNCAMAFIYDNKHIRIYDDSVMLLIKMYNDILKTNSISINPAPSWRLLNVYGGHLNINEFRESFNKIEYEPHGVTRNFIRQESIGYIYEQKIKF